MEGAGMPHPVRTLHEDLGLAQIFLGPVHAQSQGITLMVHLPQPLAPQLAHCRSPSPWNRWSHALIGICAPGRDVAPMVRASRFHGAPLWVHPWEDRSGTHRSERRREDSRPASPNLEVHRADNRSGTHPWERRRPRRHDPQCLNRPSKQQVACTPPARSPRRICPHGPARARAFPGRIAMPNWPKQQVSLPHLEHHRGASRSASPNRGDHRRDRHSGTHPWERRRPRRHQPPRANRPSTQPVTSTPPTRPPRTIRIGRRDRMLDWTELLTIVTVSWLGIMSPGPDFVVVVRHSVSYGRRHGLTAALGVTTGTVVPLAYATFGAALLATQSDLVYLILQYAGSTYLAWLGFRALRSRPAPPDLDPLRLASPDTPDTALEASPIPTEVPTRLRTFWTGVLITSLNAKAGLFYLSLFAMAVSANTPVAPRLLYCAYILISTMIWTSVVATLFGHGTVRRTFRAFGHWFDRFMGGVFILLALRTAFARR
ncbi:MAG: LysE family translocator [Proteobacteria bacterium]|nr:LysE family translocator [Pseudomonadota bacterium]